MLSSGLPALIFLSYPGENIDCIFVYRFWYCIAVQRKPDSRALR